MTKLRRGTSSWSAWPCRPGADSGIVVHHDRRRGQIMRGPARRGHERGPDALGRIEQEAWQAYYERRWARLASLLLRITREHFELSLWQTPYATYLATRAQLVFARQANEGG